ncbi:hypothetical protein NKR23_g10919 [Pleurostoma richardsiae]|uniref:Uncharacterized protein n=1 Tax=Pleurostoma richardsiae TaxID=41990 RepID=A0AA38R4D6_9PEZI|nr:hypothetical protein NKR23_g10919 [Pleurostoma richardsiae]
MEPKSVILGMDLGSTSARAFLWCPGRGPGVIVENKRWKNLGRSEASDFSTSCHPFDDEGPVYVGEEPDPGRQSLSLKYALYVLADAPDELLPQCALARPVLGLEGDRAFRDRLKEGLRQLFATIQQRVSAVCTRKKLRVSTIALSTPALWEADFTDRYRAVYRAIVADVFAHPSSRICFRTETNALAHYLFTDHLEELPLDGHRHHVILLLDFGGHSMKGCVLNVVCGDDETFSFVQKGEDFGTDGGSAHWDHYVGEMWDGVTSETKQMLLLDFNQAKRRGYGCDVTVSCGNEDQFVWRKVMAAESKRCFEVALCQPLAMAARQIKLVSEMKTTHNCMVIVSGRTTRVDELQTTLTSMCNEAGLKNPVFTDSLYGIKNEDVNLAIGAAYGAEYESEVRKHFARLFQTPRPRPADSILRC